MANQSRRSQAAANARQKARKSAAGRPQAKVGKPTGQTTAAPATGLRHSFENKTGPLLVMMHGLPRWAVPVGLAFTLFFGLLLKEQWAWLGASLLGLVALFLGWLLALSWPMLSPGSRTIRLVVVVAIAGIAVLRLLGNW